MILHEYIQTRSAKHDKSFAQHLSQNFVRYWYFLEMALQIYSKVMDIYIYIYMRHVIEAGKECVKLHRDAKGVMGEKYMGEPNRC